jgi:2-dehydropantoate 2-reductase
MGAPRVLIVGCGAIGGVLAGYLIENGQDVTLLTTNAEIARALRERGVRVRGDSAPPTGHAAAVYEALDPSVAPFDFVLLATQPPQVEEAARRALGVLHDDGRMVCFQNGLCEERVAKIAGAERVIGAVVTWGASMIEPGLYDRTSAGGFALGRLDGTRDARLVELSHMLEAIGPVTTTENLRGARWSKLAINCAISTLGTIGGDRLGVLMRERHVRRLALEIMTEAVRVARAEGVRLEKVSGTLDLDWIALTDAEKSAAGSASLLAKHTLLLAVGARYRRLRSSMLAAIERGRTPAVEFLNGEVIERAERHGIPTPVNRAARERVWAIARGEQQSAHATLRALYEQVLCP